MGSDLEPTDNCVMYLLDRHIEAGLGNKPALIEWKAQSREVVTYGELWYRVRAATAELQRRHGYAVQQRIAIIGSSTVDTIVTWLATMRAGHLACLLSPNEKNEYYTFLWPKLKASEVFSDWTVPNRVVQGWMPPVQDEAGSDVVLEGGVRPALVLMTSGSTGTPKACVHTHRAFLDFEERVSRCAWGLDHGDVVLGTSGPYFSFGLQAIHSALMVGATAVLLPQRKDQLELLDVIESERATVFLAVPTLLQMLLRRKTRTYDVRCLRLTLAAGEKLPACIRCAWFDWTQGTILNSIGTTETFLPYLSEYAAEQGGGLRAISCFDYRFPGYDDDPTGETRVASVESESMMLGYLDDHGRLSARDKWFNTRDVFRAVSPGRWEFTCRDSEFVKIGGTWVAPQALEEELLRLPGVARAAAAPVQTAEGLIRLRAFVVLASDAAARASWNPLEADALLRAALPMWSLRPDRLEVVDSLPSTASGKLLRRELQAFVGAIESNREPVTAHSV